MWALSLAVSKPIFASGKVWPRVYVDLENTSNAAQGNVTVIGDRSRLQSVISRSGLQKLSLGPFKRFTAGQCVELILSRPGSCKEIDIIVEIVDECQNDIVIPINHMRILEQIIFERPVSRVSTIRSSQDPVPGISGLLLVLNRKLTTSSGASSTTSCHQRARNTKRKRGAKSQKHDARKAAAGGCEEDQSNGHTTKFWCLIVVWSVE